MENKQHGTKRTKQNDKSMMKSKNKPQISMRCMKMKAQPYKIYGTQQSYSNGIVTKADMYINGTEYRDNKYMHTTTYNLRQKRQ